MCAFGILFQVHANNSAPLQYGNLGAVVLIYSAAYSIR